MILPDHKIRKLGESGAIDPFNNEQVEPASYDVRLHRVFRRVSSHRIAKIDLRYPIKDYTERIDDPLGYILHPGEFVLGATKEVFQIPGSLAARVEGKSSLGRIGLLIHMAGFIDPGFRGRITLELKNDFDVAIHLHAEDLIGQICFLRMESEPVTLYNGRYQDDMEVAPSRYRGNQAIMHRKR